MTPKAAFVNELVTEPFNDFYNGVKRNSAFCIFNCTHNIIKKKRLIGHRRFIIIFSPLILSQ